VLLPLHDCSFHSTNCDDDSLALVVDRFILVLYCTVGSCTVQYLRRTVL